MKRLCQTCKNKRCIHLCNFQKHPAPAPKIIQLKG